MEAETDEMEVEMEVEMEEMIAEARLWSKVK